MATTTPNYGWAVPTSTDLVKDGATAIETLGDAIDASLVDLRGGTTGQVLKKASATQMDFEWGSASSGLTLINTTSFSGVASIDITSVFSATYKRYLILLKTTAATTYSLNARLLSGSTPNTAANYYRSRLRLLNATTTGSTETNNTEWTLSDSSQTATFTKINIFYPFEAENTYLENWTRFTGSSTASTGFDLLSATHTVASSFDGIRFYSSSPNFTAGEVSVFGYAN